MKNSKNILLIILLLAFNSYCADTNVNGKICKSDNECDPPYFICGKEKNCEHKEILPITLRDVVGILILLGVLSMATIAGIGGGATIVPLAIILFYFDVKEAVALSNFLIFCNGLVKLFFGLNKKHPHLPFKTIIDYNTVIIFNFSIVGSAFGVILAKMLPGIIQLILLCFVVLISLYKGVRKTYQLCKKERNKVRDQTEEKEEADNKKIEKEKINKKEPEYLLL